MLKIGQKAPDFNLPDETGNDISLKDFAGKNIILFFYPKDNTQGCTTESIAFSTLKSEFEKLNTVIIGVSKDSVKKHQNFIAKQNLTVKLIADVEGTLCEKYTIWVLKKLYGREYMGIERATFLIGTDGLIKKIWRKVKVKGHVDDVFETVKML